jgi:zinc and cadmium transporter
MTSLFYFILFGCVFASGLLVLAVTIPQRALKLMLAYTGAFLFSIAVLDLIPEVYSSLGKMAGVYILIGFFFQIILEFFSSGIEHGHVHHHSSKMFLTTMMISLSIHSLLEGMAVSYHPENVSDLINKGLFIGILLHHIPIAIALMALLSETSLKKGQRILMLAVFALMSPTGIFLGMHVNVLSTLPGGSYLLNITTGIVTGILLHISTTILFESSEEHRFNLYKFITVLLGAGLAVLILL